MPAKAKSPKKGAATRSQNAVSVAAAINNRISNTIVTAGVQTTGSNVPPTYQVPENDAPAMAINPGSASPASVTNSESISHATVQNPESTARQRAENSGIASPATVPVRSRGVTPERNRILDSSSYEVYQPRRLRQTAMKRTGGYSSYRRQMNNLINNIPWQTLPPINNPPRTLTTMNNNQQTSTPVNNTWQMSFPISVINTQHNMSLPTPNTQQTSIPVNNVRSMSFPIPTNQQTSFPIISTRHTTIPINNNCQTSTPRNNNPQTSTRVSQEMELDYRCTVESIQRSINHQKTDMRGLIKSRLCGNYPWNVDWRKAEMEDQNLLPKKWKKLMAPLMHLVSAYECGICFMKFSSVEDARKHYHTKLHVQYHLEKIEAESVHKNYLPSSWKQNLQKEPKQMLRNVEGPDLYW